MAAWDDIDLNEFAFAEPVETYTYPCPCGDNFFITVQDLLDGEDLAPCPSCSLLLRVLYDPEEFFASIELLEHEPFEENTHCEAISDLKDPASRVSLVEEGHEETPRASFGPNTE